ncbi:MAG: hypothetical protein OXT67_11135 [Zetaproteobacteria bacterium]|nr:hypothetical protein [Zetaproteobacteria bacterium]
MKPSVDAYCHQVERFCQAIASHSSPYCLALVGEGPFLSVDALTKVSSCWHKLHTVQTVVRVDVSTGDYRGRLEALGAHGLFDAPQLTLVSGFAKRKNKLEILELLGRVRPSGFVVLADLGSESKPLLQRLHALNATICPVLEPKYAAFREWARWQSCFFKLKFTDAALVQLGIWCQEDCMLLTNELSKLALILANHTQVCDWKNIAPLIHVEREEHVFALTDHLLEGRAGAAIALCRNLIAQGESPLSVLGIFTRHLYQRLAFYPDGGSEVNKGLVRRLPARVKARFERCARQESYTEVVRLISRCQAAELAFKTGKRGASIVDELTLLAEQAAVART